MRRRHPKRTITREIRTRRPRHPGRQTAELEALTWPDSIRVRDRMTRPVATVHSDALVSGAVELMRSRRIRHLPVVDEKGVCGIVTIGDLMAHDVTDQQATIQYLNEYIFGVR